MALPTVLRAVQAGHIATVRALLDQGYHPDTPVGDDEEILLCWAAAYGHLPIVVLLLERGADVGLIPGHGMGGPALTDALFAGHYEVAELLVDAGAQVDYVHAAALGMLDRVREHDEDQSERWDAFLSACKTGKTEVVEYLVERGIDVTIYPAGSEYGGIGASGLHFAAAGNHLELARWLVDAGTPVDIVDDTFENTPLGWALLDGNRAMAKLLLELGADRELAQA